MTRKQSDEIMNKNNHILIFCGQNSLDIKDGVSYALLQKSEVLIKTFRRLFNLRGDEQ